MYATLDIQILDLYSGNIEFIKNGASPTYIKNRRHVDVIKNITLPAWKNQISLAISLQEQKNSVQLAKAIDDTTNDLLRRNAELLHQNSVDTAKANQRSVIDVETLEHVQNTLIKTVNDVIQIQKEGMQKRAEATTRLRALQESLNHLVLENSGQTPKS